MNNYVFTNLVNRRFSLLKIASLLVFVFCFGYSQNSYALSGTYAVGSGYDYANLAAIAAALNGGTITGNCVFELQANYTEAPSSTISFTTWTGNTLYTVTIRPASGVSAMLVTAGDPGSGLPLINLTGTQSIIFDGSPGGSGDTILWTIQNSRTSSTVGPAVEMTGGANKNTFQFLKIESGNSQGSSGTVFLYCSSSGPGNSGDIIQNCNIAPNGTTYPANAICAYGYGPGYANSFISVLNNNIHDFFSSFPSTAGCGVNVTGTGLNTDYGDHWTITGNSFYRTVNNSISDVELTVINFAASPLGNGSTGNVISNNYIGGSASAIAGGAIIGTWITAANTSNSNSVEGINVEAQSATVSGNVIGGIFNLFVGGQSGFTGIYIPGGNAAGSCTISNNIIGSTYGPGSFYWGTSNTSISSISAGSKTITTQSGLSYKTGDTVRIATVAGQNGGYYSWYMEGNVTAYNSTTGSLTVNVVRYLGSGSNINQWNITLANGIQSSGQYYMEGIWATVNGGTCSISGNTIGNLTNTNGNSYTTSGIVAQDGAYTITGNTVYNLANQSANTNSVLYVGVYGSVVGISDQSVTSAVQTVSNNTVYNLYTLLSGSYANNITGIELNGITNSSRTHLADANFIYSLAAPNGATLTQINGIYLYSGTYQLTNNIIRLGIRSDTTSIKASAAIQGITDGESGSSSSGTQKFYHNTVYIDGTGIAGGTVNSYCFRRNNVNFSPKDIIDVRNNIFVNNRSNASGTAAHFGIGLDNNSTVTSDYNDIYGNGTGFNFGQSGGAAYATQVAWTETNTGLDVNSKNADPLLSSPESVTPDFHLTAGTPCDEVAGATALFPTDFYGNIRANYTPVDLGAVVFGGPNAISTFIVDGLQFNVSPNPLVDQLTVTINSKPENGNGLLSVYNIRGEIIYSRKQELSKNKQEIIIDTSSYASGVYMVQFETGKNKYSVKIIKS